jgi:hypothetical protein
MDVQIVILLTLPRAFCTAFGPPAGVKDYLLAQGLWPAHVTTERWRISDGGGYVAELTVTLPLFEDTL